MKRRKMGTVKRIAMVVLGLLIVLYLTFEALKAVNIEGDASTELWFEDTVFDQDSVPTLTKTDGEDYRILLFADLQLDMSPGRDTKALELMDKMVEETEPDFIMTVGDNASWSFADVTTKRLIKRFESYNLPWGVTLGNHDSEGRADRNWHGNRYEEAQNSLFSMGPGNLTGVGNYTLNIVDQKGLPVYSLIMMDSNIKRAYESGEDYDFINYDQIKWYEWVVKGMNEGQTVPSMLFFHIPLPEFRVAATEAADNDPTVFGENKEDIFSAPVNSGLFVKVKALGSTTHIFSGHDHINSLSTDYQGVRLTYGLKTGPVSYWDESMQGATLITIKDGSNEVIVEHIYE